MSHPILSKWLAGTTCHSQREGRSILFENEEYIVLKHNSHSSYSGRFSSNGTCRAFAVLYRKSDLVVDATGYNRILFSGEGGIKGWDGRISKLKIANECRELGIIFEPTSDTEGARR